MSELGLAEMVAGLRKELQKAVKEGEGEEVRFGLGEVTLEAQVVVTKKGEGKVGFNIFAVEVGGSGGVSNAQTQKVVLKLKPHADLLLGA